jgi:hypothetical protein
MFCYTSRDAYNGCLTLFSDAEGEHRGIIRLSIKKHMEPTKNIIVPEEYERGTFKYRLPLLISESIADLAQLRVDYTPSRSIVGCVTKILLTDDIEHFTQLQQILQSRSYNMQFTMENCQLEDINNWPLLSHPLSVTPGRATTLSLSSSNMDDWHMCDQTDDDKWEIVSMETDTEKSTIQFPTVQSSEFQSKPSYLEIATRMLLHSSSRNMVSQTKGQSTNKWNPKIVVVENKRLSRSAVEVETLEEDIDEWDFYNDYEAYKSSAARSRVNATNANIAFNNKKLLGMTTRHKFGVK